MRRALLTLLAVAACADDAQTEPDAGTRDAEAPDATTSTLCWERCPDDHFLEPWPPEDPTYVICNEHETTCDLLACNDERLDCSYGPLWCPDELNGACICYAGSEADHPNTWCKRPQK